MMLEMASHHSRAKPAIINVVARISRILQQRKISALPLRGYPAVRADLHDMDAVFATIRRTTEANAVSICRGGGIMEGEVTAGLTREARHHRNHSGEQAVRRHWSSRSDMAFSSAATDAFVALSF